MTEAQQFDSSEDVRKEDERADAFAAFVVIVVAVLAGIHFAYTGGLPGFVTNVL
jgi:hypothetical protein